VHTYVDLTESKYQIGDLVLAPFERDKGNVGIRVLVLAPFASTRMYACRRACDNIRVPEMRCSKLQGLGFRV